MNKKPRYTAVFEFDGYEPYVNRGDTWKGGKLCRVSFSDELVVLDELKKLVEAIAEGEGDPQQMAIQTLEQIKHMYEPNI